LKRIITAVEGNQFRKRAILDCGHTQTFSTRYPVSTGMEVDCDCCIDTDKERKSAGRSGWNLGAHRRMARA